MAGAGYKLFNTGDVLTAAQVNTYLQEQTVMVFANSTARTTALSGVLAEGMVTYLKDTDAVEKYNGSAWVSIGGSASPLTTKGDLYTYSTADARLAVGNNGETLVADSSATTGLRWQVPVNVNPVLNSAFQIWQRGTSVATSTTSVKNYTADQWNLYRGALVSGATVSRQDVNDTTNLPSIQYCARVSRTAGNTGTERIGFEFSAETSNSIPLVGKTVTLSFYARKGADFSAASSILPFYLVQGTGTDQSCANTGFTGQSNAISGNATLTTTWQRFSATGTIATTSKEIGISFLHTPSGTAGAADYYEVTGVQIDVGSVATPFKTNGGTLAGELAACQRYYFRNSPNSLYGYHANGSAVSSTKALMTFFPPVTMRVSPTSVDFSNVGLADGVVGIFAITGVVVEYAGTGPIGIGITGASGLTTNRPYIFCNSNNTSGYFGLSAEL